MFSVNCNTCDRPLIFDYSASLEEYLSKVDYTTDTFDKIGEIAINSPLIYLCIQCKEKFKYTISELEAKMRETVYKDVKAYRRSYVFKKIISPASIDVDSGLMYCGNCIGVDNEGNCYKSIINVCPFYKNNEI